MVKILTLKNRQDFVRAAKGVKVVCSSLIVQAALSLPNKEGRKQKIFYNEIKDNSSSTNIFQIGFTATKKLGKAHIRNKVKRRIRAAAKKILPQYGLNGVDYVLIGRYNTCDIEFKNLEKDLTYGINKINYLIKDKKNG